MDTTRIKRPVSHHNYAALVRVCDESHISLEEIIRGTELTTSSIKDLKQYSTWEDFITIGNRIFDQATEEQMKRMAYYGVFAKEYGRFSFVLTGLVKPTLLFYAQAKLVGRILFKNATYKYEKHSDSKISLNVQFKEDQLLPKRLWEVYQEVYSLFPTFVGAPRANVTRVENGNECTFNISIINKFTFFDKIKLSARYIIDARKNLELLTMLHESQLENEKLAETLRSRNKDLEKERKLNNILLGCLGHDIANLVHTNKMSIRLLEKNLANNELDKVQVKISKIKSHLDTIGNISHISRSLSNQLSGKDKSEAIGELCNLKYLIMKIQDELAQSFDRKNISVDMIDNIKENVYIFTEPTIFTRSIIANILTNAIKFTPRDGSISIELDNSKNKSIASITITDTGMGMSPDQEKNLFSFSNRYTSKGTEGEKGSGLGMSIVKELVDFYNGEISVTSSMEPQNSGTSIRLSFPIYDCPNEIYDQEKLDQHSSKQLQL